VWWMVLAIVSYAFLRVLAEWADLGIAEMFIAPPVLALAVTIERLHGARPPRRQGSY